MYFFTYANGEVSVQTGLEFFNFSIIRCMFVGLLPSLKAPAADGSVQYRIRDSVLVAESLV